MSIRPNTNQSPINHWPGRHCNPAVHRPSRTVIASRHSPARPIGFICDMLETFFARSAIHVPMFSIFITSLASHEHLRAQRIKLPPSPSGSVRSTIDYRHFPASVKFAVTHTPVRAWGPEQDGAAPYLAERSGQCSLGQT